MEQLKNKEYWTYIIVCSLICALIFKSIFIGIIFGLAIAQGQYIYKQNKLKNKY